MKSRQLVKVQFHLYEDDKYSNMMELNLGTIQSGGSERDHVMEGAVHSEPTEIEMNRADESQLLNLDQPWEANPAYNRQQRV